MPAIMCDFSYKSQNLKSEHLETSGKISKKICRQNMTRTKIQYIKTNCAVGTVKL